MKTVLTVDDSSSIRQMVKFVLTKAGYAVSEAENGRKGLGQAVQSRYDMIITDLNMPELNGIDMIREIRKLPQHKATPIVFLTTESADNLKSEAKGAGANGWLIKPFNQEQLVGVVRRFVG